MASNTKLDLRNQVMYSIFVRNYSERGTFAAVECDLDRIKELGVDIIWFMPIHPVGEKAKKGELGSPYANKNYREINPEFGNMDDFKSVVRTIKKTLATAGVFFCVFCFTFILQILHKNLCMDFTIME